VGNELAFAWMCVPSLKSLQTQLTSSIDAETCSQAKEDAVTDSQHETGQRRDHGHV
jgi:hypothetical protein